MGVVEQLWAIGLANAPDDFGDPMGALIFGAPIGADIGAAAGDIIWAYTDPQRR
jgi:hypothetical protein